MLNDLRSLDSMNLLPLKGLVLPIQLGLVDVKYAYTLLLVHKLRWSYPML